MRTTIATLSCLLALLLTHCAPPCPERYATLPPPGDSLTPPKFAAANESWRANRPAPGPEPMTVIPKFSETRLDNGLRVIVSERRDLPLVAVALATQAGSASEDAKDAGLADLTYELMGRPLQEEAKL